MIVKVDKEVSESESLGSQRSLRSQQSEDFGLGKDALPCLTDEQLEANTSVVITETQTIPIFKIYGTEVCEGLVNSQLSYKSLFFKFEKRYCWTRVSYARKIK